MKKLMLANLFFVCLSVSLMASPILLSNTTTEDIRRLLGNWNSEARIGASSDPSTNLINPNPVINFIISKTQNNEYFLSTYEQKSFAIERIIGVSDKSYILILVSSDEDGQIIEPMKKSALLFVIDQKNKALVSDLTNEVFEKSNFEYSFIRLMGPD